METNTETPMVDEQELVMVDQVEEEGGSLDLEDTPAPCPVCAQEPKQPLLLDCLHPVCKGCLGEGLAELVCSRCRVTTSLINKSLPEDFVNQGGGDKLSDSDGITSAPGLSDEVVTSGLPELMAVVKGKTEVLPDEVSELSNTLGELQEQRDGVRSLIEETYQSYKAMLENCKELALVELEERHNKKELVIMEKLEQVDIVENSLEHAMQYTEKLLKLGSQPQVLALEPVVASHMQQMLGQLDLKCPTDPDTDLEWTSDREQFLGSLQQSFGKFSIASPQPAGPGETLVQAIMKRDGSNSDLASLGQLVTSSTTLGHTSDLPSLGHLVTTSTTLLGQVTSSTGLLSTCQLPLTSPSLSVPLSPLPSAPSPLPSHGPIGSSLSSPAHQAYHGVGGRGLGLSHPDLSLSSLGTHHHHHPLRGSTPPQDTFTLASQLASMAEKLGEQQRSTSSLNISVAGPPSTPSFTLADLISNVGVGEEGEEARASSWDSDHHQARHQTPGPPDSRGQHLALSNLAALAKLEEFNQGPESPRWGHNQPDPNLLLPNLNRDLGGLTRSLSNLGSDSGVSPGTHSLISPGTHSLVSPGGHSLSPVMGGSCLTVPGVMGLQRGTSPISPIDNLMPGLGSLGGSISPLPPNVLTQPILRSGINMGGLMQPGSTQPRALNSMQIRCKFGQLGPGKGQFNSPHGFCLGLDEEIIVADTNNHRIQVFEKNGTYRYQFGIPGKEEGQLWYPRKVAVMKNSGKFVVCDRGNERSRMQIFTKHGHFVRKIAIRYIDIVAGLAITRDGNIVAVDSVTPTMFVISEQGELLRWFDCADYMREPSDIAVGGREFYVCDFKGHNVVVFTEDGVFQRRIGCENITNFPNGIDISDAGDILIGDSHGNRFHVAVFANDGGLLAEFECPHVKVSRCCGLKITSEGYVVTLAKNNHHVLVLNTLYIA